LAVFATGTEAEFALELEREFSPGLVLVLAFDSCLFGLWFFVESVFAVAAAAAVVEETYSLTSKFRYSVEIDTVETETDCGLVR